MKVSLGFGDVKCMQAFNVYFSHRFFVLWRSVMYYVRTCTDIIIILNNKKFNFFLSCSLICKCFPCVMTKRNLAWNETTYNSFKPLLCLVFFFYLYLWIDPCLLVCLVHVILFIIRIHIFPANSANLDAAQIRCRFMRHITKTRLFKYIENCTFKNWKFLDKNSDIFSNYCSKHRLWVLVRTVLTSTQNLCFWAEIRKIIYTPVNPSFTI